MSCGNDPDAAKEEGEPLMPKRRHFLRTDPKLCVRCHTARGAYMLRSLPYCPDCFFPSIKQRFIRHIFGPLRPGSSRKNAIRPPIQAGQVVVAVSGGVGSMAMLSQLQEAGLVGKGDGARVDKTKGEKEVVWEQGTLVYVEFAGVTGMAERTAEMEDVARSHGLRFVGIRAEEVFDRKLEERLRSGEPGASSDHLDRLRSLLASLPSVSRPSILQTILDHLLTLAAHSLPNVSHLLLGETSTREAQRVISATATGRGWALPLELAGKFILPSDSLRVMRLKPMKEISLKEAAIYSHLRRLSTMNERRWLDGRSSGGRGKGSTSLEMLTEQFVLGLSVTHPSTVSTINKTGDKLVFSGDVSADLCPLCQMPAEPSAQAWKSRTALTTLPDKPSQTLDDINHQRSRLDPLLCYACLTTLGTHSAGKVHGVKSDASDLELPIWVQDRVEQRRVVSQEEMRKGIEEYLL